MGGCGDREPGAEATCSRCSCTGGGQQGLQAGAAPRAPAGAAGALSAKAVQAAARSARDDAAELRSAEQDVIELVRRVEAVFRQEQAQWGQLTAQIEIPDDTRT
jgi:hypothetical protein